MARTMTSYSTPKKLSTSMASRTRKKQKKAGPSAVASHSAVPSTAKVPTYQERVLAAMFSLTKAARRAHKKRAFAHTSIMSLCSKRAKSHEGRYSSTLSSLVASARKSLLDEGLIERSSPGKFILAESTREEMTKSKSKRGGETTDEEEAAAKVLVHRHRQDDSDEVAKVDQPSKRTSVKRRKTYGKSAARKVRQRVGDHARSSSPIGIDRRLREARAEAEDSGNVSDVSSLADQEDEQEEQGALQVYQPQGDSASERTLMRLTKTELAKRLLQARNRLRQLEDRDEQETEQIQRLRRDLNIVSDSYRDKEHEIEGHVERIERLEDRIRELGGALTPRVGEGQVIEEHGAEHSEGEPDLGGMDYIEYEEIVPETQPASSSTQQQAGTGREDATTSEGKDNKQSKEDQGSKNASSGEEDQLAGESEREPIASSSPAALQPSKRQSSDDSEQSQGDASERVKLGEHDLGPRKERFATPDVLPTRTRSEEPFHEPGSDEESVIPRYDDFIERLKETVPERAVDLRRELAEVKDELAVKVDQALAATARADNLSKQLEERQRSAKETEDELAEKRAAQEILTCELEVTRQALQEAQADRQTTETIVRESLKQTGRTLIGTIGHTTVENAGFGEHTATGLLQWVKERAKDVETVVSELRAEKDNWQHSKVALETRVESLQREQVAAIQVARDREQDLVKEIGRIQAQLNTTQSELGKALDDRGRAAILAQERFEQLDSLRGVIYGLGDAAGINDTDDGEVIVERARLMIADLQSSIEQQDGQIEELQSAFGELQDSDDLMRASLSSANERLAQLEGTDKAKEEALSELVGKASLALGIEGNDARDAAKVLSALSTKVDRLSMLEQELQVAMNESAERQQLINELYKEVFALAHYVGYRHEGIQPVAPLELVRGVRDEYDVIRKQVERLNAELDLERTRSNGLHEQMTANQVARDAALRKCGAVQQELIDIRSGMEALLKGSRSGARGPEFDAGSSGEDA